MTLGYLEISLSESMPTAQRCCQAHSPFHAQLRTWRHPTLLLALHSSHPTPSCGNHRERRTQIKARLSLGYTHHPRMKSFYRTPSAGAKRIGNSSVITRGSGKESWRGRETKSANRSGNRSPLSGSGVRAMPIFVARTGCSAHARTHVHACMTTAPTHAHCDTHLSTGSVSWTNDSGKSQKKKSELPHSWCTSPLHVLSCQALSSSARES